MGLLDSNKVKLQNKSGFAVATNVTGTGNWEIDCKDYTTLALIVKSAGAGSSFKFQKKCGTDFGYSDYYFFNVYVMESSGTNVYPNNAVEVSIGSGKFVYIDVSDCDSVKIFKTDSGSSTVSITGTLYQEAISNAIINYSVNHNIDNALTNGVPNVPVYKNNQVLVSTPTTSATSFTAINCAGFKTAVFTVISVIGARIQVIKTRNGQNNRYIAEDVDVHGSGNTCHYLREASENNNLFIDSTSIVITVDCDGCDSIQIVKIDSDYAINSIRYSLTQFAFKPAKEWYLIKDAASDAFDITIKRRTGMRTLLVKANVINTSCEFGIQNSLFPNKEITLYVETDDGSFGEYTNSNNIKLQQGYNNVYIDISAIDKINFTKQSGKTAAFEFIQSPDNFTSSVQTKIDSLSPASRLTKLFTTNDYDISMCDYLKNTGWIRLGAVWENIAVWHTNSAVYISNDGIDGKVTKVELESSASNFPGLIPNSTIKKIMIVPYTRRTSSDAPVTYSGADWRLVIFTNNFQIYHNFPSVADDYDGANLTNGEYLFDESVVWDLPDRINPVKTDSGTDTTLITTGKYKYIPCLPDHMYEMHPTINQSNPYGNHGFDAVKTYTDERTNNQVKRARFFMPVRNFAEANPFEWLSGCIQDTQISAIGTYIGSYNYMGRIVVVVTNDGREWFVQKEYGAHGAIISEGNDGDASYEIPWSAFAEYGDPSINRLKFGTATMSNSSAFTLKKRMQYTPNAFEKDPEVTYDGHTGHRFKYGEGIAISRIVSSNSDGIVVTTSTAHNLLNGDIIVIEKNGAGESAWNWLCAEEYDAMQSGNGTIWKIELLNKTTFRLMLEVGNPNENLTVRHVHSLNLSKDGIIISCGEEHPYGWIELIHNTKCDAYGRNYAGNIYPIYRLNSSENSVQRTLGTELIDEEGGQYVYFGSDTSNVSRNIAVMPENRHITFDNSSLGIYKITLKDIDDYDKAVCLLNIKEPAYFFKIVNGIMVFCGQQGTVALSKDMGKNWTVFRVPSTLFGTYWLLGSTVNNEICIRVGNNSLVIKCKV